MNKIKTTHLLGLLLCSILTYAQSKEKQHIQQIWLGYFNQTRFSDKWGIWFDAQLRTKEDFVEDLAQVLLRPGLTYYLNDATKLTAAYAYVHHFPIEPHSDISRPEHRPWQQIQWHTKYARAETMQWVRLEERFRRKIKDSATLAEGYNFNYRARYNILLQLPLSKRGAAPKTFSFVVNDEVLVNFGEEIVYNYFDQNRFFVGLNYHVSQRDFIQFGYMNLFQQLPTGNQYRSIHAARVFYFHNMDLRRREKER